MAENYLQPDDLARYVIESQAQGRMTDELARAVRLIATRTLRGWHGERHDIMQAAVCSVARRLMDLDPGRNLFAYVTTAVRHAMQDEARFRSATRRLARHYGPWLAARVGRQQLQA